MSHPTPDSAYGIWSLNEIRDAVRGQNWPGSEILTSGRLYADSYLATTGGSLITVASDGDVRAAIDGSTDGDAILIDEGTYAFGPATSSVLIHSGKEVLIAGNTDTPQSVVIDFDHDANGDTRDHPVFGAQNLTTNTQLAFLTFYRNPTTTISTNYNSSLLKGGGGQSRGIAVNVYFDLDDKLVAWHYDNNDYTTHDVRYLRCTFANYSSWTASYSGRDDVVDVGNCLFDDTTDQTEYVDLGSNVYSATVNTASRSYSTSSYPTAGHLYIPNTTAVF